MKGPNFSIRACIVALVLSLAGAFAPSPALANSALRRLVMSEIGEFIFTRHSHGERWAMSLLGRRISPGSADDLARLATAMEAETAQARLIREEMERRLTAISTELEASETAARGLRARERVLRDLTERLLRAQPSTSLVGALEFVPLATRAGAAGPTNFAQIRALMLRVTTIEEALPIASRSIEGNIVSGGGASVYEKIFNLHSRYLGEGGGILDPNGIARTLALRSGAGQRTVTLLEALEEQARMQNALAGELEALAAQYPRQPLLQSSLRTAAAEVRPTAEALQDMAMYRDRFASMPSGSQEFRSAISEYGRKVPGELGELRVMVRVENVVARGVRARDLGRFWGGPAVNDARAALFRLVRDNSRLFSRELDLIIGSNARAFAEIKAYIQPMGVGHPRWARVLEQAEYAAEIRNLLNGSTAIRRTIGGPITQRLYFINGIEDGAATQLERLGIEVYGPRLEDTNMLFRGAS